MLDRIETKYNSLRNMKFERLSIGDLIEDEAYYLLRKNKSLADYVSIDKLIKDIELIIISYGLYEIVRNRRKHRDPNKVIREKIEDTPVKILEILNQVDSQKKFSQMLFISHRLEDDIELLYGNDSRFEDFKSKKIVESKVENNKTKHMLTYEELFTMVKKAYIRADADVSLVKNISTYETSISFADAVRRKTSKKYVNKRDTDLLKAIRLFGLESKWHYNSIVRLFHKDIKVNQEKYLEVLTNIGNSTMFYNVENCFTQFYEQLKRNQEVDLSIINNIENDLMKPLLLYALKFVHLLDTNSCIEIIGSTLTSAIDKLHFGIFELDRNDFDKVRVARYFELFILNYRKVEVKQYMIDEVKTKSKRERLVEKCQLVIKNIYHNDLIIDSTSWINSLIYEQLIILDFKNYLTLSDLIKILESNMDKLSNFSSSNDWENDEKVNTSDIINKFEYFLKNSLHNLHVCFDNHNNILLPRTIGVFYLSLFYLRNHPVAKNLKYDHQGCSIWTKNTSFKNYVEYLKLVNDVLYLFVDKKTTYDELACLSEQFYSGNLIIAIAKAVKSATKKFVKLSKKDKERLSRKLLELRKINDIVERQKYCKLNGKKILQLVDEEMTYVDYEINGLLTIIKEDVNEVVKEVLSEYDYFDLENIKNEVTSYFSYSSISNDFHRNLWRLEEDEIKIVMSVGRK
ncbi:MAG: hypothetical protein JXR88_08835 [Clostridia bacterium]|nr:hypothetical protein [Clostridia bacterium]